MENETVKTDSVLVSAPEEKTAEEKTRKFPMPNMKVVIPVAVVLLLAVAGYFLKGVFVAALVDGSPVSRLSVLRELEKQSGATVLASLIEKKLVQARVKDVPLSDDELNAEYAVVEAEVVAQGRDLKSVLLELGMTEGELREKISIQKKLEKLLADKTAVTDAEIAEFIKANKSAIPKTLTGDALRATVTKQISQQKFSQEVGKLIAELRAQATIRYFVEYSGLAK